ncbi:MAG: hypothetical protein ONA90_06830, partial [candidate division KSB1 bacterium]|nr:hypothetical protein [candidate division KSB1 bacterium]
GATNASAFATSAEEVFKTRYTIHAKSRAHLSFGLAAGLVERADFVVAGNRLKISTREKKELDQQFYALVNLHLGGHDLDRFHRYRALSFRKFMLQGGLGLSSHPLDKLYAGLGYRLAVAVQIDLLHFWSREPNREQTVSLDNAASIEEAKNKFEKTYYAGNFAVGLSFYPRRLFGFLGW